MIYSVDMIHADPCRSSRDLWRRVFRDARAVDASIAFVTRAGVDLFGTLTRDTPASAAGQCRLSVSLQFPTNLEALASLKPVLGDRLLIHLGSETPQEKQVRQPPLLHSKLVRVVREPGICDIVIGSHNWTATALDGINFEASVHVRCDEGDALALAAKEHLDRCAAACVPFDPGRIEYYKAIQRDYYPPKPSDAEREYADEFGPTPPDATHPAVVIHAEDRRDLGDEEILLFLPLKDRDNPAWYDPTVPTHVFLFLYPPGSLLGHSPPRNRPDLYQGNVTTFGRVRENPIRDQAASGVIDDLRAPELRDLPSKTIPPPNSGDFAQVLVTLALQATSVDLPVFHSGSRPAVRETPEYVPETAPGHEVTEGDADDGLVPFFYVWNTYTPESLSGSNFLFRVPRPASTLSLEVPGRHLYREDVTSLVGASLRRKASPPVIKIKPVSPGRYVYQAKYMLVLGERG